MGADVRQTAYETQITKLETERLVKQEQLDQLSAQNVIRLPDYNVASRTALGFLLNPLIYWASGNVNARRTVAKLAFADSLHYHREKGFSNPKMTLPFQLIQSLNSNRKEETMQIEKMVPPRGHDLNRLFEILSEWERELQSLNLDDILNVENENDGGMQP